MVTSRHFRDQNGAFLPKYEDLVPQVTVLLNLASLRKKAGGGYLLHALFFLLLSSGQEW